MPIISVIVPTKNRVDAVVNTVQSVFAGRFQEFDLFVIDQTLDGTVETALAAFAQDARFHYHRNDKPGVGAASSRNLGIALSSSELIAVIDDDVTVQPDWLAQIVTEFTADPALDFICGKLTALPYDWREGYTPAFDAPADLSRWQMPVAAAGANFSMRRSLLERIGGYDEFCGPGSRLGASDDGDLTWRIVRSGAKWKACAQAEVIHTFGFRPGKDGAALLKRYQVGIGGNFGRFARRGDLFAAFYFLLWQLHVSLRALGLLLIGRPPHGLGWVRDRLIGFRKGFLLPPDDGFVSGRDLTQLHLRLAKAPSRENTEFETYGFAQNQLDHSVL